MMENEDISYDVDVEDVQAETNKDKASILCCVCNGISDGAHSCIVCKRTTHSICGIRPDGEGEGYGCRVICNNCKEEPKGGSNMYHSPERSITVKRKTIQGIQPWWIKPKVAKTSAVDVKKKDPTINCGICLTCYSAGESPDIFKLCRVNKSTIERHSTRRHQGKEPEIRQLNDKDETVSKAREYSNKWENSTSKGKKDMKGKKNAKATFVKETPGLPKTVVPSIFNVPKTKAVEPVVTKPIPILVDQSSHSSVLDNDKESCGDSSLHLKIDTLISEFRDFKLHSKSGKELASTPLAAVDGKCTKEISELLLKWPEIKNIIDLVSSCNHIRFFSGDENNGVLSVIRCETCYRFLNSRKSGRTQISTPEAIAKKGLGGYGGSLATGLIVGPEKTAQLLEGGCQEFYNLKSTVKSHITLAGGQLHFEALQFEREQNKRKTRAQSVTENLVSIALTVVKVKAAALHYETMTAAHAFTGSDLGEFGHGRKQFLDILRCANLWINRETAKFLATPLVSTKLPPHFYVTSDKSTPHRITNQAIMMCLMIEGKRRAIPVNAPEVYSDAESGAEGDVSGAEAKELAESLYGELQNTYPSLSEEVIKASYQGTVCDGAYQAAEFEATLKHLCGQENAGEFFTVLWDPPHYVDLALKDVFEGKQGSSKPFFRQLVERSSIVHRMFQRGKMLSHAIEMAKSDDDLLLRLTSRSCSTRFSASQYVEFRKLIDSLPLYIKTFRAFKYTEVKEYQIAGIDFLLDLCSVCDVLKPYIELSIALQGLSVPCWKVGLWWERLKKHMKTIENGFSFNKVSSHLPLVKKYAKEIIAGVFKNTTLVQGWLVVSSETITTGNKTETVDYWEMRDQDDVEEDVKAFMSGLRSSFEMRVTSSSKPLVDILTCLDLDSIVKLLCGERLETGKVKLQSGEGALEMYGVGNFTKFFTYVCSLPHIKRLSEAEGNEESLFDPALANAVFHKLKTGLRTFLWKGDGEHLSSWFNLPPKEIYSCLDKLEIVASGDSVAFSFTNLYAVTVRNIKKPFHASLNEDAVYESIFRDASLYDSIGLEGCICIDIALAKGGTEAVVESYYSTMASNKMSGGQHNETLSLRTKIDWSLPQCHNAGRAVKEIAQIYLGGDKDHNLSRHAVPILGDRARYKREGKVMKRLRHEDARLTYLL